VVVDVALEVVVVPMAVAVVVGGVELPVSALVVLGAKGARFWQGPSDGINVLHTWVYNIASSVPFPLAFAVNNTQNTLHHLSQPLISLTIAIVISHILE